MGEHGAEVEVPHDENDPFVKKVALSVAVFAVVLALAGAGGHNASKDMMMNQLDATDLWNQYQAKRQREVLYEQQKEQLQTELEDSKQQPAETTDRKKLRLATVEAKLKEYEEDKKELYKQANEFQAERKKAQKRDPYFDAAELLLQLAIVLASVAMLSKARWAFVAACVLAAGGLLFTLLGYFPVVSVPFIGVPEPAH